MQSSVTITLVGLERRIDYLAMHLGKGTTTALFPDAQTVIELSTALRVHSITGLGFAFVTIAVGGGLPVVPPSLLRWALVYSERCVVAGHASGAVDNRHSEERTVVPGSGRRSHI